MCLCVCVCMNVNRQGDINLAKRWFHQALMCSPTNTDVLIQYGLFLLDGLGDKASYTVAESIFQRTLAVAPTSGYALAGSAECAIFLRGSGGGVT